MVIILHTIAFCHTVCASSKGTWGIQIGFSGFEVNGLFIAIIMPNQRTPLELMPKVSRNGNFSQPM